MAWISKFLYYKPTLSIYHHKAKTSPTLFLFPPFKNSSICLIFPLSFINLRLSYILIILISYHKLSLSYSQTFVAAFSIKIFLLLQTFIHISSNKTLSLQILLLSQLISYMLQTKNGNCETKIINEQQKQEIC
jgi:hypothetical protein